MENTNNDTEQRLIKFSVDVIKASQKTENDLASEHLIKQIIRSATSPAFYYAVAENATSSVESENNMKVCLKELRATLINLKIQKGIQTISDTKELDRLIQENNELITIVDSEIKTAKNKNKNIGF
ncbi:MAG: four helix bundle protein [Bacteroidota bacterium]